jgi:hypothetical protein
MGAKSEYREGPEAKENFEKAMKSLFQLPKVASKKKQQVKPAASQKTSQKSDKG